MPTFSLSQLLCRCILKDFLKYFTRKLNLSDVFVFWIHVHKRNTNFYTVVFVNNVNITTSARIRRYTPTKRNTALLQKGKAFFIMYISMCFYTKRAKNNVKGFIELACTAMYTMCACGEQAGFVLMPPLFLYSSLLLSSDVSHKPALFLFCCCCCVGPEVFAFSPSVPCV